MTSKTGIMLATLLRRTNLVPKPLNLGRCCRMMSSFRSPDSFINTHVTTIRRSDSFITNHVVQSQCLPNSDIIKRLPVIELPSKAKSYIEIYDSIPLLDINLPTSDILTTKIVDIFQTSTTKEIDEPEMMNKHSLQCDVKKIRGPLSIRKRKMNRHKYRKRMKRDRAKLEKYARMKAKEEKKINAEKRLELIEEIKAIKEKNPKSRIDQQAWVQFRLQNW